MSQNPRAGLAQSFFDYSLMKMDWTSCYELHFHYRLHPATTAALGVGLVKVVLHAFDLKEILPVISEWILGHLLFFDAYESLFGNTFEIWILF